MGNTENFDTIFKCNSFKINSPSVKQELFGHCIHNFSSNKSSSIDQKKKQGKKRNSNVFEKSEIYVFFGYNEDGFSKDILSFDTKRKIWNKIDYTVDSSLKDAIGKSFFGSSVVGEKVYFLGGFEFESNLENEELNFTFVTNQLLAFDKNDNSLHIVKTSPKHPPFAPRAGLTLTYVQYQKKEFLYVFGGAYNKNYFNDVHMFNLNTCEWKRPSLVGETPANRAFHSSCYYQKKNQIVFFGGVNSNINGEKIFLNDIFFLDIGENKWVYPPIKGNFYPVARYLHSAAIYDDKLIVIGGQSPSISEEMTNTLEILVFDLLSYAWTSMKQASFSSTYGHSSVILDGNQIISFGGCEVQKEEQSLNFKKNDFYYCEIGPLLPVDKLSFLKKNKTLSWVDKFLHLMDRSYRLFFRIKEKDDRLLDWIKLYEGGELSYYFGNFDDSLSYEFKIQAWNKNSDAASIDCVTFYQPKKGITVLESQGPLVAPSAIIRFKKKKLNSPNENVADIVVVEVNELYKEQWNSGSEKKYYVEVNCAFSNSDFNNESEFPLTASKMHKTSDISSKRKEKNELNNLNYDIVSVIESKSFSTDEHIEKLMISLDLKELNEKFAKDVFLNQYQDGNLIDRGTIRKRKGVDSHTWPAEDNVKITYQFRVRAENGLGSSPIGSVVGEKVEVNVYGTNLNQEEQILQVNIEDGTCSKLVDNSVEKLNPVADEEIINDMSTETNDLEYSFLDDDRYSSQQNSEFNDFSRPGSPFNDSSTIYPTLGQFGESFPVFPDTWHFKLGFGDQFLHNWKNTFYLARALYYTVEMDGKIKLKLHYVGYNPKKHDKEIVISKYIKKVNINNKLEIEKRLKKHFKQFSTDLTAGKDYNNLFEIQEENGWFDSNSEACLYKDVITEFENNFEQGQILVQKKL